MKIKCKEYSGTMSVSLEAETLEDASFLTRLGINGTKKVFFDSSAQTDGTFTAYIAIRKRQRQQSSIPRAR